MKKVFLVILRLLLAFIVVLALLAIVQETTFYYLRLQIYRSVFLILVFALFIRFYPLRYGLTAVGILLLILVFITIIDFGTLNLYRIVVDSSILIGATLGYFWRVKQWRVFVPLLAFVTVGSFYLHNYIYSIPVFDNSPSFEVSELNKNREFLIGHNGEHPSFYKDTVYLVNFSFHNCTPCQRKKKYLPKIREHFDGKAFKIIEVHIFEKKEVFDKIYMLDYPFVYHDSLNHVNQLFGVSGGPEELLFDKKGRAVRKHVGFSPDEGEQYVKETIAFINELLAD